VIVFDGVCALCNRWVRFLLRFDRRGATALRRCRGSRAARCCARTGWTRRTDVVPAAGRAGAWTDTDAILRVLAAGRRLAPDRRAAVVPRGWRDAAYARWRATATAGSGARRCHLPAPEQAARFLD
jgi:predicted DCC family thiol-disulfide oxidoreductase YuxK